MRKKFPLLILFIALFTSVEKKIYAADTDDEEIEPFPMAVFQTPLNKGISLEGMRHLIVTASTARNLTSPWTNNLYAQLPKFLRGGNVLHVTGEAYPLVLLLAADCGERIVFHLDETLPSGEQEVVFHLDESLRSHVGVSSLPYPYSPLNKDDGPPLMETGNATVLVSADLSVSDAETRRFPVAICFRYGNGWVFYSSFQIENRAISREGRSLAAALAALLQAVSGKWR